MRLPCPQLPWRECLLGITCTALILNDLTIDDMGLCTWAGVVMTSGHKPPYQRHQADEEKNDDGVVHLVVRRQKSVVVARPVVDEG